MQTKLFITPAHIGGMPECFMSYRRCPICGSCNEETFLIDGADYQCDCCNTILTYRVPKQKKRKPKFFGYSYLLTWNGL